MSSQKHIWTVTLSADDPDHVAALIAEMLNTKLIHGLHKHLRGGFLLPGICLCAYILTDKFYP